MAVPILKQGPFLIASIQSALTDTDVGWLNRAPQPTPSTAPEAPGVPAIVETRWLARSILRTVWLFVSAT